MTHCVTSSTGVATRVTARVRILTQYCKGCGLCVSVCPAGVLALADEVNKDGIRVATVRQPAQCKGCGRCYLMCPDAAVEVEAAQA